MPSEQHATLPNNLHLLSLTPPAPRATLALIHGYGDHAARHLSLLRFLADHGIAAHAVDLRGQGRSPGRRGYVQHWPDYLDDVATFLAAPQLAHTPRFVLGHSHGGLLLAAAGLAHRLPNVAGCIFTSPFFKSCLPVPRHKILLAKLANPLLPWLPVHSGLTDAMMTSDEAMRAETRADPLVTRTATPRWYLGTLAAQADVMSRAAEFVHPMLMLTGSADPIADPDAAHDFTTRAASTDKTEKQYPGLLHELLRERTRDAVFADVLNWINGRLI